MTFGGGEVEHEVRRMKAISGVSLASSNNSPSSVYRRLERRGRR
jgi:hypothetical protein